MVFVESARFLGAVQTMRPRHAVLLNPLEATLLDCLPFYKQNVPVTPLEATLAKPLVSVADKGFITPLEATLTRFSPATPLDATLTKNLGEGPLPSRRGIPCCHFGEYNMAGRGQGRIPDAGGLR